MRASHPRIRRSLIVLFILVAALPAPAQETQVKMALALGKSLTSPGVAFSADGKRVAFCLLL